ncbi:MAG: DUF2207 domain-containing protein, partial [Propionibacteriaceae bacterium]|nr:DUF2207 domain-containing protein [Propionibacteriaceae bacterium]
MKRLALGLIAALLAGFLAFSAPLAHAAGDQFTRFDIQVTVDENGVMSVTQTVDLTFGSSGHGPYFYFITRQGYSSDQDRLYTYRDFRVKSPTGAPTNIDKTTERNYIQLRIGDPNKTVRGTQTYVVTYTLTGMVNPNVEESGLDEIYWNAIGSDFTLPISNITVTINSPGRATKTTCYAGVGSTPCQAHSISGSKVTFTQDYLAPGQPLTVVAGWPKETFPGASVNLVTTSTNP